MKPNLATMIRYFTLGVRLEALERKPRERRRDLQ